MNILIVGLGSIGKRHLRNIIKLGYDNISVVSRSGVLPEEFLTLKHYTSIEIALDHSYYDVAVICTPTSKHIENLKPLIAAGIQKIYLEKPVSHSVDDVESIINCC